MPKLSVPVSVTYIALQRQCFSRVYCGYLAMLSLAFISASAVWRVTAHNNSRLRAHGSLSTAGQPLSSSAGVSTKAEMGAHYAEISVFALLCPFPYSSSTVYCYSPSIQAVGTELIFPVALSKAQVRHTQARAPSYVQEPVWLIRSCENELNGFQGHLVSENCFCAT